MSSDNSRATLYLSVATLILGVLGLLFGDNILEKFSEPKLAMSSTKVKLNLPDKLNKVITETTTTNKTQNLPTSYRVIEITNQGSSPSENLRLILNLDGEIYDYKYESTEKINEQDTESHEIALEMGRLSPNAKIVFEIWMRDDNEKFQVRYADDTNSEELTQDDENSGNKIFTLLMTILSVLSTGFLVYKISNTYTKQKLNEVNFENQELENQIKSFYEHLKEESEQDSLEENTIPVDKEDTYKRLEQFMRDTSKRL